MSKFKVKFKIQALELEIEGTRDELPQIAEAIGGQLTSMLQPASKIIEAQPSLFTSESSKMIEVSALPSKRSPTRRRKATSTTNGTHDTKPKKLIEWKHDAAKWGMPKQAWSATQKIVWFLHVSENYFEGLELTAGQISASFNHAFKQAGILSAKHVKGNLDSLKIRKILNEDTTKSPSSWSLTESGKKQGSELVTQANN
jgi:hypothetical protein